MKEAKRSLKLDSANVDVWRLLAQSQVETKEYADALASYEALKRRKAFKPEDQGKYGLSLFRLGRDDEALKSLLEAVAMDSTNCDAYFSLGSDLHEEAGLCNKRRRCSTSGSLRSEVDLPRSVSERRGIAHADKELSRACASCSRRRSR